MPVPMFVLLVKLYPSGQIVVGNATDSGHLPHCPKNRRMSSGCSCRLHSHSAEVLPGRGSNVLMCSQRMYSSAIVPASPYVAEPTSPHGRPVNRTCDPPFFVHKPSTDVHNVKLTVVLSPLGKHFTAGTHGFGCGGGGGGSGGNIMAAQLSSSSPIPAKDLDWPTSHSVTFSCRNPRVIVSQL